MIFHVLYFASRKRFHGHIAIFMGNFPAMDMLNDRITCSNDRSLSLRLTINGLICFFVRLTGIRRLFSFIVIVMLVRCRSSKDTPVSTGLLFSTDNTSYVLWRLRLLLSPPTVNLLKESRVETFFRLLLLPGTLCLIPRSFKLVIWAPRAPCAPYSVPSVLLVLLIIACLCFAILSHQ
jgi:hypothetical protein